MPSLSGSGKPDTELEIARLAARSKAENEFSMARATVDAVRDALASAQTAPRD